MLGNALEKGAPATGVPADTPYLLGQDCGRICHFGYRRRRRKVRLVRNLGKGISQRSPRHTWGLRLQAGIGCFVVSRQVCMSEGKLGTAAAADH